MRGASEEDDGPSAVLGCVKLFSFWREAGDALKGFPQPQPLNRIEGDEQTGPRRGARIRRQQRSVCFPDAKAVEQRENV